MRSERQELLEEITEAIADLYNIKMCLYDGGGQPRTINKKIIHYYRKAVIRKMNKREIEYAMDRIIQSESQKDL